MDLHRPTAVDAAAISAFVRSLGHYFTIHADGAGAEAFFENMNEAATRARLDDPDYRYFLVWDGDRLAAVGAWRGPSHLYHLFVGEAYQGRGMGRALWQALAAQVAPGLDITVNASAHAHQFYRKLGFEDTAPRTEMHGIAFHPMLLRAARNQA